MRKYFPLSSSNCLSTDHVLLVSIKDSTINPTLLTSSSITPSVLIIESTDGTISSTRLLVQVTQLTSSDAAFDVNSVSIVNALMSEARSGNIDNQQYTLFISPKGKLRNLSTSTSLCLSQLYCAAHDDAQVMDLEFPKDIPQYPDSLLQ
eukprot:CAMPEP_0178980130 /NCGR_PEP_ID=MMETSP0789-20121207/26302_1 /TAXON_ID=3005 /ORGANISM="Rhizosolenia setigera, Strain CCMP 1694" /LENGTH=148 /DNA_ID=CAMNT_0020670463 /DNA_START=146 /DNA_END=590 /DNA_ORIENTATION=-